LCGRAISQPQVLIFDLRPAVVALAQDNGKLSCCWRSLNTENPRQLCHHIGTTGRALVQIDGPCYQRLGIPGATGKTTGSAIGSGQNLHCGKFPWVNFHGKLLGGKAKRNRGDQTDASET
jgi:hypothetical protein